MEYLSPSSSAASTSPSSILNCLFNPRTIMISFNTQRNFSVAASFFSRPPSLEINPSLPSPVQKFWRWLREEGVVSPKCPVKPEMDLELGLGLVAQRDIGRNEAILEVPKRFWINPDTVSASEIGKACASLKPWISVALFLIRERTRADSPWRFYIDILPENTDSTIYWSEEELSELHGTQLLSTTLNVKLYVKNEFLKIEKEVIIPNKQLFPSPITVHDFLWAFGMLRSRAFSRLRGQNLVLVPFADLLNHNSSIKNQEYAWEIKGAGLFSTDLLFSIRNPVSLNAGEQVFIQYDLEKSNSDLAVDYGFIEESRPQRYTYSLMLGIPESDPFFEDKIDIVESNGLGKSAFFDVALECPLPLSMLQYLRLVAIGGTDAFLLESIFRGTVWGIVELPVSRDNEELICKVVRDACKSALCGYHTTIEEDEEKLKEGGMGARVKIAVEMRRGEKKVLREMDDVFKDRESTLGKLEYYQERRLKDFGFV